MLEAGNPGNGWVRDIHKTPIVELRFNQHVGRYVLEPQGAETHQSIRAAMRESYGWRDWWVALIFDTSQSYAIHAIPHATSYSTMSYSTTSHSPTSATRDK